MAALFEMHALDFIDFRDIRHLCPGIIELEMLACVHVMIV